MQSKFTRLVFVFILYNYLIINETVVLFRYAVFILRAKVRIIRMRKVPFIDSTGLHNLSVMCEQSEEQGIQVVLSGGCQL